MHTKLRKECIKQLGLVINVSKAKRFIAFNIVIRTFAANCSTVISEHTVSCINAAPNKCQYRSAAITSSFLLEYSSEYLNE